MDEIKVLLVDDQAILLDGLKAILETCSGIEVTGIACEGKEALAAIERGKPDVVLMDIRMPGMNGIECTKIIKGRWPEISVLMLTTFDDEEYIFEALKAGSCGYLLKDINREKLLQAVQDAYRGDTILPAKVAQRIVGKMSAPRKPEDALRDAPGLSEREAEVAVMLSQGFTNRQISASIHISEGTVKNYVSSIYEKLGVESRTAAALRIQEIIK